MSAGDLTFGELLTRRRIEKCLSQHRLYLLTGVSSMSIATYESAGVVPCSENAKRLAKVLGADMEELASLSRVSDHRRWSQGRHDETKTRLLASQCRRSRLTRLRAEHGMTIADLSVATGLTQSLISSLETGYRSPRGEKGWASGAETLASFFGVSVSWIWPEHVDERRAFESLEALADSGELDAYQVVESPEESMIAAEEASADRDRVLRAVALIGDVASRVISRRFGLSSEEEETQDEIAREFGCTRQNVSLVERRALRRLRGFFPERAR